MYTVYACLGASVCHDCVNTQVCICICTCIHVYSTSAMCVFACAYDVCVCKDSTCHKYIMHKYVCLYTNICISMCMQFASVSCRQSQMQFIISDSSIFPPQPWQEVRPHDFPLWGSFIKPLWLTDHSSKKQRYLNSPRLTV